MTALSTGKRSSKRACRLNRIDFFPGQGAKKPSPCTRQKSKPGTGRELLATEYCSTSSMGQGKAMRAPAWLASVAERAALSTIGLPCQGMLGVIHLSQAHYHCASGKTSYAPLDARLEMGRFSLSEGPQRAMSPPTAYMSNEEAVDTLEEITRLHVGHETARAVVESVGAERFV